MKTQTTPPLPSIPQLNGQAGGLGWKRDFRLNALDLDPQLGAARREQAHWISQEPHLMRTLEQMRVDLQVLNQLLANAGEQPLPVDTDALLTMLGVAAESAPAGLPSKLLFSAKLLKGLWRFHSHVAAARFNMHRSWRLTAP